MQVILLVGLQASGKTSFFNARFSGTHLRISKDAWPNARNKERRVKRDLEAALRVGRDVVVDHTHPSAQDRAPVIALATQCGAEVVGYYFASRVEECLRRNGAREGRARVPEVAIYSTIKRMERPRREEGFGTLHYVELLAPEGFSVSEWKDDMA